MTEKLETERKKLEKLEKELEIERIETETEN